MKWFRRRGVLALALTALLTLCTATFLPPCRAQTKETAPPPGLPASLWVKDRFARAGRYDFPEQKYLVTTIVNDTTGEKKEVCIPGRALLYAVCLENNLPVSEGIDAEDKGDVRAKGERIILKNRARVFHFTKAQAWTEAQPRYTPELLAQARERFRTVSAEEIARRFGADDRHLDGEEAKALLADAPKNEAYEAGSDPSYFTQYLDAVAAVWTERGLYVGRHFFWGRPYVITPAKVAVWDEEERVETDRLRRGEAARQKIVARVPHSAAMHTRFVVTEASENAYKYAIGPCLSFIVQPKEKGVIGSFYWYVPLSRAGNARTDWAQFVQFAGHLERLARLHPWLKTWKDHDGIRNIAVGILGRKPMTDAPDKRGIAVLPLWKRAGLREKPYCQLIFSEVVDDIVEQGYASVFLPVPGSGETRSLIATNRPLHSPDSPTNDWLANLPFQSDPKADLRQCAVVTPGGAWNLITLQKAKPLPPPPGVPASLWVPDRFERAARNLSSAPSYLMATIVNDITGESGRVCLEGPTLFEAVRIENNLGRGWGGSQENWDKAMRLILNNTTRAYHFKNPEAWKIVGPRDAPEYRALVEQELRGQSVEDLARRFDGSHPPGGFFSGDLRPGNLSASCAALARVLTERGLYVGRGDAGNDLYVITPKMIADDDRERQKIEKNSHEQRKREEAKGRAFAARVPGYTALTQQFILTNSHIGDYFSQGPCFSAGLQWKSPHLVSSMDWFNPINNARRSRYNWNQFLPAASHVERVAQKYPWLRAWKNASTHRRIEAQIFGKVALDASDDALHNNVMPAWKDAGLGGAPSYKFTLRWEENGVDGWAVLYLPSPNSRETRALITSACLPNRANGANASGPSVSYVYSRATAYPRECIVVSPSGAWKRLQLPLRTPLRP